MDQEKIGKLIAKLRKSKGLTQKELGEMVGVGFRAVSKWETGLTSPDISIINDLSKILGISADELLKGEVKEKEVLPKRKSKNKNIIYIIIVLTIIILSIIFAIINKNKTYVYNLITPNSDYYIEGELIFKNKNILLKINKIGFEDTKFKTTIINNYQYEITCDDNFIVGYGYMLAYQALPNPTTIENWHNQFTINYNVNINLSRQKILKKGLNLKITFLDNENNTIVKDIKIEVRNQKITHSTYQVE